MRPSAERACREEPVDLVLVGQVGLEHRRAVERGGHLARPLLAAVVVDGDAGALGGERARARSADPAGCAGDEHSLACEPGLHERLGYSHARPHHQRHGRHLRDREARADERRRPDVRGGPQALHRGDQRGRPRREGGRRDRDRRHGLPRSRRRLDVQLAHPRSARARLRVGRAGGVDGLHRVPGAGLRRGALRRHAREGRRPAREHEPHGLGPRLPAALVQRDRGRRDRDQRGALRHVGLPRPARHRRSSPRARRGRHCSATG